MLVFFLKLCLQFQAFMSMSFSNTLQIKRKIQDGHQDGRQLKKLTIFVTFLGKFLNKYMYFLKFSIIFVCHSFNLKVSCQWVQGTWKHKKINPRWPQIWLTNDEITKFFFFATFFRILVKYRISAFLILLLSSNFLF